VRRKRRATYHLGAFGSAGQLTITFSSCGGQLGSDKATASQEALTIRQERNAPPFFAYLKLDLGMDPETAEM